MHDSSAQQVSRRSFLMKLWALPLLILSAGPALANEAAALLGGFVGGMLAGGFQSGRRSRYSGRGSRRVRTTARPARARTRSASGSAPRSVGGGSGANEASKVKATLD